MVEVAGLERFHIKVVDRERIAQAEKLLKTGERAGPSGLLRPGDGGFNAPYCWHLDPETVRFGEKRDIESDRLPIEVEEHLDRWLREKVRYAPWASRIVARVESH